MKKNISLIIIAIFLAVNTFSQIYEPVKWTKELKITGERTADVIIHASIDEGWHLYGIHLPKDGPRATAIVFESVKNAQKVGELQTPSKLHKAYDANFDMELNWYTTQADFIQKISYTDISNVEVKGYIEFMACNDQSCLPPSQEPFNLGAPAQAHPATLAVPLDSAKLTKVTDYWTPVINELKAFGETGGSTGSTSLWLIFLAGLLGGFLALFTPCVWPIIPMTVSFFLKRSDNKSRGQRDAVLYGLAIIFIYVFLGILITLIFGASALNSLSTNAIFNLIFFALLVVFAISFFGAFEITLPASWSTKLDAKADSTAGFISILFMAFTLVLVSFSCTGPIIGTLLVQVSGSGSLLAPAIGMLGFAVALSIPFSLFALFPSWLKTMPRSGGWLNSVKVVLAFLELALALKFLSVADLAYGWRILDREVFISIWIVIFVLLGIYLLGKLRFSHDSDAKHTSVFGLFMALISFAFAVYMVPGLWGAPLKAISAFAPPLYTQDFSLYKDEVHPAFTDYDLGMAYAAEKKLPVLVDFTGFGCVNCRKMEASVWTDSRVKDLLNKDFVLISLFVDDKTALANPYEVQENGRTRSIGTVGDKWSYLQRIKFGANAQPFYVMLDNSGKPLNKSYSFDENPEHFVKWLKAKK
ncbi:MAG: cytochrome c biogenesis protein CcdA [Paludibacter sp.]|jgi:thiol:disulfide interchange protein DsbD|nr:cytochrome c biogenesis protein CcdA [Paludibacter sp.]